MNPSQDVIAQTLLAFLRAQRQEPALDYAVPPTQLQGGYETHVYRFQLNDPRGEGGLTQPLILRLYPARFGAGNAVRESTVQTVLAESGYPAPRVHSLCTDLTLLGGAFFIMDCLPGSPLALAPLETVPALLGQTQAALHRIDPTPLAAALTARGLDTQHFHFDGRLADLQRRAAALPWLLDAVTWLIEEEPPAPPQLAVCHGDFHPFNVLAQDGVVTAVLDWPGFLIADPVQDLATTLVLMTIPVKQIGPTLGLDFSPTGIAAFVQRYLAAYQAVQPRDLTHLAYYQALRSVSALIEGVEGHTIWQQPTVVADLIESIQTITGVPLQSRER
jgi:aminoglycoside phosphotransferase (APT) family kinase protein